MRSCMCFRKLNEIQQLEYEVVWLTLWPKGGSTTGNLMTAPKWSVNVLSKFDHNCLVEFCICYEQVTTMAC